MPLALIDKQDNFSIIRDEIAAILAVETVNQQNLALAAGKNPDLWKYAVYKERLRPWELLDNDEEPVFPIVNIWFESENFATNQAAMALDQVAEPGLFNIDVFTPALNIKFIGDGYQTADQQVSLDCQRIITLIRNILYSVPPDVREAGDDYTFLNLRGIVFDRRIDSIKFFKTDNEGQAINIGFARIVLSVKYSETALEGPLEDLELLQAQTETTDGGQVIYEFDLTS